MLEKSQSFLSFYLGRCLGEVKNKKSLVEVGGMLDLRFWKEDKMISPLQMKGSTPIGGGVLKKRLILLYSVFQNPPSRRQTPSTPAHGSGLHLKGGNQFENSLDHSSSSGGVAAYFLTLP